jgi:hypothetical protein
MHRLSARAGTAVEAKELLDTRYRVTGRFDNLLIDIARAIIHQQDGIFANKLIETSHFIKIGKEHHADVLTENVRVEIVDELNQNWSVNFFDITSRDRKFWLQ